MIKKSLLFILLIFLQNNFAQSENKWINGFSHRIAGENLDYHSCHPEANLSLLIRCLNDKDYIEWETEPVPQNYNTDFVTFVWIAGYSTGTSTAKHSFTLYVNDKEKFIFRTVPKSPQKGWKIRIQDGSELSFKFVKIDQVDDFFGYMQLTIPVKELNEKKSVRIKIKGDATGSRDWYMTMQYPVVPKIRIASEKIVSKNIEGKLTQRVRVSVDHFDISKPIQIFSEGKEVLNSKLNLGMNDFFINYEVAASTVEKTIQINIDGKLSEHHVTIPPARKITFYLIPHGHVDIGYTDLQTEVEKKHWQNFDNAIKYSKESQNNPAGSVFKWNVEVLWAVKSYLEKFPEKKRNFFEAVKKEWIGLDAMYCNVMTGLCRPEELYRLVDYSNQLEKEIGKKIESAMISDIPGYTWGTVQAFADNGIKYFSVGPNSSDRIGHTIEEWGDKPFYWESQSGEKKILIWIAGKGYSWFHGWRLTRDDISPIVKYIDELDSKNYPYDMVHVRYNIGGDNGFPDSSLASFVKNWNEIHETPKFKIATTQEMFKDFEAKYKKIIPTYSGDFTPYWEDGASSTADESSLNRRTAEKLIQLENLYTLSSIEKFPQKDFNEAWRYVLLYSEHTWGAWNSISDPELKFVKDQWAIKRSYAFKAGSIANSLYEKYNSEKSFSGKTAENIRVVNSSSWKRTDVVSLPAGIKTAGSMLEDESGNIIPAQKLSTGEIVFIAKDIPPFGSKQYRFENKDATKKNIYKVDQTELSNKYFKIFIDKNSGAVESLKRLDDGFEYVDGKSDYLLNAFIHTGRNAADPQTNSLPKILMKENGLVVKSLLIDSEAPGCSNLKREIILYSDLDKIDIINTIDKKKIYNKENLRFAFPFNIEKPVTRIDIAWAEIEPEKDQLSGANKNYFTSQRWIDVSNDKHGITLTTIDAPFMELGGMSAEAWINPTGQKWATKAFSSSKIYSWVMNNSWHTNFKAEQAGVTSFKYSLKPHNRFDYLSAYKFGVEQSQPLIPVFGNNLLETNSFPVFLDQNSSIVVTSMKPTHDKTAVMIRVYNPTSEKSVSELRINEKLYSEVYLSNGDEEEISRLKDKIELKPYEAVTIKINSKK